MTALFLWLALRDAPFAEVGRAIASASWGTLIGLSVPGYLVAVWMRALRWRYLTEGVQEIGTGPLFRAVSVGFMANNVFPLRVGEVVRAWYLARETGGSAAALFVTVVIERVIDTMMVIAIALSVIAYLGAGEGGVLTQGALALLPVAFLPAAGLVCLRIWPEPTRRFVLFFLRPFPDRITELVDDLLSRFRAGLGALRGGVHLLWIALYTVGIWTVSAVPVLAGILALHLDVGGPSEVLVASFATLAAIGVGVALPSAPGFFGPYHFACKLALLSFGVPPEQAVAVGTLTHAVFWVSMTALGLAVLRIRGTSLSEIESATAPEETASER